MTTIHQMLVLAATVLALSTLPGRAGPCAQDIDRAWPESDTRDFMRESQPGALRPERDRPSPSPADTELDRGS